MVKCSACGNASSPARKRSLISTDCHFSHLSQKYIFPLYIDTRLADNAWKNIIAPQKNATGNLNTVLPIVSAGKCPPQVIILPISQSNIVLVCMRWIH